MSYQGWFESVWPTIRDRRYQNALMKLLTKLNIKSAQMQYNDTW